ncbi:MAG TPA: hypothetical protein VGJ94_00385 [Syntrophorhabdaceae bacterium]|jgi:hypothetical protein
MAWQDRGTKKGMAILLAGLFFIAALAACQETTKPVTASMEAQVFSEVTDASVPSEGMACLTLRSSVKIPTPEHYVLHRIEKPSLEGGFPFELEVDGQEILWKVEGAPGVDPVYGPQGRIAEGGVGMRYVLEKTIGLAEGPHHLVFGVPYDDFYMEVNVFLEGGETHTLEFQPVYAMGRKGYRTFFRGISMTAVFLDGVRIN